MGDTVSYVIVLVLLVSLVGSLAINLLYVHLYLYVFREEVYTKNRFEQISEIKYVFIVICFLFYFVVFKLLIEFDVTGAFDTFSSLSENSHHLSIHESLLDLEVIMENGGNGNASSSTDSDSDANTNNTPSMSNLSPAVSRYNQSIKRNFKCSYCKLKLVQLRPRKQFVFNRNNNSTIKCNICEHPIIPAKELYYHCSSTNEELHRHHGFDTCEDCAEKQWNTKHRLSVIVL